MFETLGLRHPKPPAQGEFGALLTGQRYIEGYNGMAASQPTLTVGVLQRLMMKLVDDD